MAPKNAPNKVGNRKAGTVSRGNSTRAAAQEIPSTGAISPFAMPLPPTPEALRSRQTSTSMVDPLLLVPDMALPNLAAMPVESGRISTQRLGVDPLHNFSSPRDLMSPGNQRDEDLFSWLLFNSDDIDGNLLLSSRTSDFLGSPLGVGSPLLGESSPNTPGSLEVNLHPPLLGLESSSPLHTAGRPALNSINGSEDGSLRDGYLSKDDLSSESDAESSMTGRTPTPRSTLGLTEEEKRKRRLLQNRESARESRKRRLQRLGETETKLKRLEAENLSLKLRLKVGKEALQREKEEKDRIKQQLAEMIQNGASEESIAQFVNMYKQRYSDYGKDRRIEINYHLQKIKEYILPTQVTKMCLYSVANGGRKPASHDISEEPRLADWCDPMSEEQREADTLWSILVRDLEVSDEQQGQILKRRKKVRELVDDLQESLDVLEDLRGVTNEKNVALDAEVNEMQHILSPSQTAKFILWVKKNPAFMYMLNKFTDAALGTTSKSPTSIG